MGLLKPDQINVVTGSINNDFIPTEGWVNDRLHPTLEPVTNFVDFTTAEPPAPTVGDRNINTVTGTSSITTQSVTANYIYEWNGTNLTETIPTAGIQVYVIGLSAFYQYTGTAWTKAEGFLNQKQIYYFGDAGNDLNDGLSIEKPFLTAGAANAAALAQTPSISNQFEIQCIGSPLINADFTTYSWVTYNLENARLLGHITGQDDSVLNIENWEGDTPGSFMYTKSTGSGRSYINCSGEIEIGGSIKGFKCTSGEILISTRHFTYTDDRAIGEDSTGKIILKASQVNGDGDFIYSNASGEIIVECPEIESGSGANVKIIAGGGIVYLTGGRMIASSAGGQIYDVAAGRLIYSSLYEFEDTASSLSGTGEIRKISGHDPANQYTIYNSLEKIRLITDSPGKGIDLIANGNNSDINITPGLLGKPVISRYPKFTNLPFFSVERTGQAVNVTGNNVPYIVIYQNTIKDNDSNFTLGTGTFNAPVNGQYRFSGSWGILNLQNVHTLMYAYLVTSNRGYTFWTGDPWAMGEITSPGYKRLHMCFAAEADMDAGDSAYIILNVRNGSQTVWIDGSVNRWQGSLITAY